MKYFQQQRGMTLIEIMISLLIGVFLIGGILQIFLNTQQTYRTQENLSRMQENGRFAMEFLTKDIRMADFWGCVDASAIENKLNPSGTFDPYGNGIAGVDDDNGSNDGDSDNDENGNGTWDGTDSITLRGATGGIVSVLEEPTNNAASIKIADNSGLSVNDIVVISNCAAGDIFQIVNITGGAGFDNVIHNTGGNPSEGDADYPGNASAKLEAKLEADSIGPHDSKYGPDSNIYKVQFVDYRIGTDVSGEPSLSRSINGANFQPLIEGIENLQILYGEDTDADNTPNYYVDADDVVNMDNVVSVRITLTVRSLANNISTTGDGRLRRVFSSTISIRNRLP